MKTVFLFFIIFGLLAGVFHLCGFSKDAAAGMALLSLILIPVALIFYYNAFPSGKKKARALRIAECRKKREWREKQEYFSVPGNAVSEITEEDLEELEEDLQYEALCERQRDWLEDMRLECSRCSGSLGEPDYYYNYNLMARLPLDEFEEYVGTDDWNYQLSRYIDWAEFRKWYPELEVFPYYPEDD